MFPSLQRDDKKSSARHYATFQATAAVKLESSSLHSPADLNTLEQLVNLVIGKLLSQTSQHVAQLACSDVAVALLVKHLETTDELLCACVFVVERQLRDDRVLLSFEYTYLACQLA